MRLYYEMATVAKACGKSTSAVRLWLQRHGMAKKVGGRWVVARRALLSEANLRETVHQLDGQVRP